MTTTHTVELGFDWHADPNPDGSGNRPLQWGVVKTSTNPHQLGTLNDLQAGDQIMFVIYDVTQLTNPSGSPSGTAPSIAANWMTWRPADSASNNSVPFDEDLQTFDSAGLGSLGPRQSTFFGSAPLPAWQIVSGNGELTATVQAPTGSTPSSFELTWQITVTSNGDRRNYRVDPEMIVKPGG